MSGSAPLLRVAEAGDAAAMAVLQGACFPQEPWDAEAFRSLLAMPGALGLILDIRGDMAGLILLRQAADEVEVVTLAVAEDWRRQGCGGLLLSRGLERAMKSGARRAFLEVAEDNAAARRLYAAAGFQVCGRRVAYYRRGSTRVCDALVLAAPLPLPGV